MNAHSTDLHILLEKFHPSCPIETKNKLAIQQFITTYPNCFSRSLAHGHITASAWIINKQGDKALLTLHKKLHMWLQLGGHADDDSDVLNVALREAREESGIQHFTPVSSSIFDVDIHVIPANAKEPEHLHYDIRFLLRAEDENCMISDESLDLRWFNKQEIMQLDIDESVTRLYKKWLEL